MELLFQFAAFVQILPRQLSIVRILRVLLHQPIDPRSTASIDGKMEQSMSIYIFYQINRSILDRRHRSMVELISHRHHALPAALA
jgi:hypothetical protein